MPKRAEASTLARASRPHYAPDKAVASLNTLRNELCVRYGFRNGAPRINLGPCGRFARDFHREWNSRFQEEVTIAFVMSNADIANCYHVLIKLPDGRFCDGGNGVVTQEFLKTLYPDGHIDEMKQFDAVLLDERSYGLSRAYSECPNYSDEFTQRTIAKRLSELSSRSTQ